MGYLGCEMFGIGMFEMWNVRDVRCLGCGMRDVFRNVGC